MTSPVKFDVEIVFDNGNVQMINRGSLSVLEFFLTDIIRKGSFEHINIYPTDETNRMDLKYRTNYARNCISERRNVGL